MHLEWKQWSHCALLLQQMVSPTSYEQRQMLHDPGAHRESPHCACACECRLPDDIDCWRWANKGGRDGDEDDSAVAKPPAPSVVTCSRPCSDRELLFLLLLLPPPGSAIISRLRLPNNRPGTGIRTNRLSSKSSSSSSLVRVAADPFNVGSAVSDGTAKLSSARTWHRSIASKKERADV